MNNTNLNIKKFLDFYSNQDDSFGMSDLWSDYIKDFDFLNSKSIRPSYKTNINRSNKRITNQIRLNNHLKNLPIFYLK
jgi:hypothetical protein